MTFFPYLVAALVILLVVGIAIKKLINVFQTSEMLDFDRRKIEERWVEIEDTFKQGVMGSKLAIIEADKLVDQVLKSMFMAGDNMGQRLKFAAYKYPAINRVWDAHKLRNQLVHDPGFHLSSRHAREALNDFRKALQVLRVL